MIVHKKSIFLSDNNNTTDEMENSFKEFFHATPNHTLSMAYFLTDLSEHEWNESKFVHNMIQKTDLFANIINKTPVYTKFIQYTEVGECNNKV